MQNLFISQHQLSWKVAGLLSILSSRLNSSPTSLGSQIPSQCSAEEPAVEHSAGASNTEEVSRKSIYSYKYIRSKRNCCKTFCTEPLNTDLEVTSNSSSVYFICIYRQQFLHLKEKPHLKLPQWIILTIHRAKDCCQTRRLM